MNVQTFLKFAKAVVNENMQYLLDETDPEEIEKTAELLVEIAEACKRAVVYKLESAELISLTEQLLYMYIVAYADSDEFELHELANNFFDELEGN